MSLEWRKSFASFLRDVGRRPTPKHSLDRIDNDGHYVLHNVRWASREQQANNTRANRFVEAFGQRLTIANLAKDPRCVVSYKLLWYRINAGWEVESATITRSRLRVQ